VGKLGTASRYGQIFRDHVNPIFYQDQSTGYPARATLESTLDMPLSALYISALVRYQIDPDAWYHPRRDLLLQVSSSHPPHSARRSSFPITSRTLTPIATQPASAPFAGERNCLRSQKSRMAVTGRRRDVDSGPGGNISDAGIGCVELCRSRILRGLRFPACFIPKSEVRFLTVTLTLGIRVSKSEEIPSCHIDSQDVLCREWETCVRQTEWMDCRTPGIFRQPDWNAGPSDTPGGRILSRGAPSC